MEKLPVFAIERHRITTDGVGVTTLVGAYGCPLQCKYCLNPHAWNPNTIQKAYKILEERELITSHGGAKSVMTLDENKITKIRRDLIAEEAGNFIRAMDAIGLNKNEALTLLDRLWEV